MSLKTIETLDRRPFKHFCATIGELPTSFIDSMSYYELLAWFCQHLEKTVIPAINENAEAVKELQDLFVKLKEYVDNYFANLDVQEEINNKLDEMAEAGTLQEIVIAYLAMPIKGKLNVQQDGRFIVPNGNKGLASGDVKSPYSNAQGYCIVNATHHIILQLNRDDESNVKIVEFNPTNGYIYREQIVNFLGHGNSCTYIDGFIYVAPYFSNKIIKVNYNTLTLEEEFTLSIEPKMITKNGNDVLVGTDTTLYVWEKDTTNFTQKFVFNTPEFTNLNDGYYQDITSIGNYIYLIASAYSNSKVLIFVFNKDTGELYTTYDMGTHNNLMYFGEGQGIDCINNDVYFISRFDCNIYNDYSVIALNHINPITNVFAKKEMYPLDTTETYRIVNNTATNFYADGSVANPFKYYFEFLIANQFVPYNMGMSLKGVEQPLMKILNAENAYLVDTTTNKVKINGMLISNSNVKIQGLYINGTSGEYNSDVYVNRSSVNVNGVTIGDATTPSSRYCIYADGSTLSLKSTTFNTTVMPVMNNYSTINNSSNVTTTYVKFAQQQGVYLWNNATSPFENNAITFTFSDRIKTLLLDSGVGKRIEVEYTVNAHTDYFYLSFTGTASSQTFTRTLFFRVAGKVYTANLNVNFNPNSGCALSISDIYDANGTQASGITISGGATYKILV